MSFDDAASGVGVSQSGKSGGDAAGYAGAGAGAAGGHAGGLGVEIGRASCRERV